jgi:hypothetical protein
MVSEHKLSPFSVQLSDQFLHLLSTSADSGCYKFFKFARYVLESMARTVAMFVIANFTCLVPITH